MSVYDDIRTLIADEQREVVEQVQAADRALAEAEERHATTVDPLQQRLVDLNHLDDETKALAEAAAAPVPTSPSEPEQPSSTGTSESQSTPTPEEASSSVESSPTAPFASLSTVLAEQVIPQDAIALADVADAIDAGVPESVPVTIPTATGEIAVVTVGDVIAASDPAVADADLTEAQQVVRNSDLP